MNPTATIFFVLLAAYVQANTTELSPSALYKVKLSAECIKESNATPEQAKIFYKIKDVPKDDGEACFMECIYKKTDGIGADGKYNVEAFNKLVDMKYKGDENVEAKKIAADCATKATPKEGEKCSLGKRIRECFAAATKEHPFFTI